MRSIGTHCLSIGVPVMNCSTMSIENGGLMKRKAAMSSRTAMNQPQNAKTATRTAAAEEIAVVAARGCGLGCRYGFGMRYRCRRIE